MLNLFSFHLISLHRSFSSKLLILYSIPLSPQPVSSHLTSTHLISSQLFPLHLHSSHLMSSLPLSALLKLSQLFSSFFMYLNFFLFISSQLRRSTQLVPTQLFSALHYSSPDRSSQPIPPHPILSQLLLLTLLCCGIPLR